ncbi:MAG: LysR family transcriptional regulator [Oscillospiraceae bacterium]|nr:LysR family transcriptional regulator [Oscillospiraceae bacterium]
MENYSSSTNFEAYKIFYFVARYSSITAAAQRLCVTQPSVTKAVQKLEEQLRCVLFVRTKRGVQLTPEGKLLWQRVEPACNLLFDAERELEAIRTLNGGTLTIVSAEMCFTIYILPALSHFMAEHPAVKVKCKNALNGRIMEMLHTGEADLAVLHTPFDRTDVRVLRDIDVTNEHLVAGDRFAEIAKGKRKLKELINVPFVSMPVGTSSRQYLEDFFQSQGLAFEPDIELTTVELVAQAVRSGFGIGMLPEQLIAEKANLGELHRIELEHPLPIRHACLIASRNAEIGLTAQAFVEEWLPETNQ